MDAITTFVSAHWLDMLSTAIGLIYITLEYRVSIALWYVAIIMPAIDIYLYWSVGIYADFGMAIYYTLAAIYGYAMWKFGGFKKSTKTAELPITHMKKSHIMPSVVVFLVAWGAIYYILVTFTNSNVPITDSFINALSFVALWALARKYLEQWLLWIVIDVISSALYIYKGIPFKGALYGLYVVIAIMGYRKWKTLLGESEE